MESSFSDTGISQLTLNAMPPNHPENSNNILRKSCEGCRALKVKCELLPETTPTSKRTCQRCAKNNQECVFIERTLRRRKRSNVRLAELEKRVEFISTFASSAGAVGSEDAHFSRQQESSSASAQDEMRKRVRINPSIPGSSIYCTSQT